ncbi:hypothetical protein [Rubrolithibacter danxiaensis]|uniref:hypothetical protein n=1 Tax=Rubrolithibacter danxiaensis TaxID=3390805 RepID=UPI003BF88A81
MKKLTAILSSIAVILVACSNNEELSREEALRLISRTMEYPKVVDYDIYCSDPKFAEKVLDAGLEEKGLVVVQRTQKLRDVNKPLIQFSGKAEQYLLKTPEKDKSIDVQKVKLAEEELQEVTGIKMMDDGKSAVANYTTAYKNITPFADLIERDLNKQEVHKAYFSLYDNGWQYEKKPEY